MSGTGLRELELKSFSKVASGLGSNLWPTVHSVQGMSECISVVQSRAEGFDVRGTVCGTTDGGVRGWGMRVTSFNK